VGRNSSPFKVISNDGIIDVYVKTKIFVTFGSRCCADRLTDGGFLKEECLSQIDVFKEEKTFNKFQMECFFKSVSSSHKRTNSIFAMFGDMKNLEPDLCESITTLTKDEFIFLNSCLPSIKNSNRRSKEQALAIYLYWLKTGLTQNMIALCFGFKPKQRLLIQSICRQVRSAFAKDFVPLYLGIFYIFLIKLKNIN
jgi:hypothetical protein